MGFAVFVRFAYSSRKNHSRGFPGLLYFADSPRKTPPDFAAEVRSAHISRKIPRDFALFVRYADSSHKTSPGSAGIVRFADSSYEAPPKYCKTCPGFFCRSTFNDHDAGIVLRNRFSCDIPVDGASPECEVFV